MPPTRKPRKPRKFFSLGVPIDIERLIAKAADIERRPRSVFIVLAAERVAKEVIARARAAEHQSAVA